MNIAMNYYFIAASVLVLTIVGAWVTEKIVEPRLGEYKGEFREKLEKLKPIEKKGLTWAGLIRRRCWYSYFIINFTFLGTASRSRRGYADYSIAIYELFSADYCNSLLCARSVYGKVTKGIRDDKDVAAMMSATMASMGMFIVLSFTAGQFVAFFSESNMGLVIGVYGAQFLDSINLTGIPLILMFILNFGVYQLIHR